MIKWIIFQPVSFPCQVRLAGGPANTDTVYGGIAATVYSVSV